MPPDFLAIGHVVKDRGPGGWRLGGSVVYAAAQAQRLGRDVGAVTACAPDLSPAEHLPWIRWHVLPSPCTASFENLYAGGRRSQRLIETAAAIGAGQVPRAWTAASAVLLGPVFHEIDPEMAAMFPPSTLVGLGAQGWLRRLEGDQVVPSAFVRDAAWLNGDVVFVSEEDVEEPERAQEWLEYVPVVVVTRGARGCTLWEQGYRHDIPAFDVPEVDPTGAGDVFAAAFLVACREGRGNRDAARFACAAAALAVRGGRLGSLADRAQIEALLSGEGARAR